MVVYRNKLLGPRVPQLALLLLLLLLAGPSAAQEPLELSATLERQQIRFGQTVKLLLVVPRRWASTGPDLTVLEADFEIIASSPRSELRIVDGDIVNTTRWVVELAPKRTGTLRIPPITVHNYRSRPMNLEVLAAQQPSIEASRPADAAADLFIETEFFPTLPYEQAQTTFVVRLFAKVAIMSGTLSEPQPANAVALRLGTEEHYQSNMHNQPYRVLERRYALFAQEPGEILIPSLRFQGELALGVTPAARPDPRFGDGRTVRIDSQPTRIPVRGRPVALQNSKSDGLNRPRWLPAMSLRLSERWSADPLTLVSGESVTRTIRIETLGLRAEQLPQIELQPISGLQSYPGQVDRQTTTDRSAVRGVLEQQFALLSRSPGTLELPAVKIKWWNLQTQSLETAELGTRQLRFLPGAPPAPIAAAALARRSPTATQAAGQLRFWQGACAGLALLWVLTLIAWHRRRPREAGARGASSSRLSAARTEVLLSCASDDAPRTHAALLAWAKVAYPLDPPRSMASLAIRLGMERGGRASSNRAADSRDAELAQALNAMERAVFAETTPWNGKQLYGLLKQSLVVSRPTRNPAPSAILPPLHPR